MGKKEEKKTETNYFSNEANKILRSEGIFTKGVDINNEKDFIRFFTSNFPSDSNTYKRFRKVIGKQYKNNSKDEYVLVFPVDNVPERDHLMYIYGDLEPTDYTFLKRSKAEYNPKYVQAVVSCIPKLPNGDIVLQFAETGDMSGYTTLISGHVSYSKDILKDPMAKFLKSNIKRELFEETGLQVGSNNFCLCEQKHDNALILKHPDRISCYHIGFIYSVPISEEQFMGIENEKGLEARRYSIKQYKDIVNPDPWLAEILSDLEDKYILSKGNEE